MATPVPGQTVDLGVYDRFHAPALAVAPGFLSELPLSDLLGYGYGMGME